MTQFFLSVHQEKNWVILTLKVESLAELNFDPIILGQNDLSISAQCTERNNWVILTPKVESLAELKFNLTFLVIMTQFFSQCTDRKNLVILTLKVESLAEL